MYPPDLLTRKRNICACEPAPVGHVKVATTDVQRLVRRCSWWTGILIGIWGALVALGCSEDHGANLPEATGFFQVAEVGPPNS